jgi:Ni,Fe-hydrogenase maturation factor
LAHFEFFLCAARHRIIIEAISDNYMPNPIRSFLIKIMNELARSYKIRLTPLLKKKIQTALKQATPEIRYGQNIDIMVD